MRITSLFFSLLLFAATSQARVSCPGPVIFESETELEIAPQEFVKVALRGVGLRTKFFVRVFYGALYLENPEHNEDEILASDSVKVFTLHALRNITKSQVEAEWDEKFNSLCGEQCEELRPFHEQFLNNSREAKKDERLSTVFLKDRVEFIAEEGTDFAPILSREYGDLLLKTLVGPRPANPGFKESVLGRGQKVCRKI